MKYWECGAKCCAVNKHDKWWCTSRKDVLKYYNWLCRDGRAGGALSFQPVWVIRLRLLWLMVISKNITLCLSGISLLCFHFLSLNFLSFTFSLCIFCFPQLSLVAFFLCFYFLFFSFPSFFLLLISFSVPLCLFCFPFLNFTLHFPPFLSFTPSFSFAFCCF